MAKVDEAIEAYDDNLAQTDEHEHTEVWSLVLRIM